MPQGKAVSAEVQWIVLRLCATMKDEEVSMYSNLCTRKVRQIRRNFEETGDVDVPARLRPKLHRSLSDTDIEVFELSF